MNDRRDPEYVETIVVVGQAGLSIGYHLVRHALPFVILEANERIGDSWRKRWDSLRLFTPARYDGLAGMPFPAPVYSFPTKDEVADHLESYASRMALPVRTSVRVDELSRNGKRFGLTSGELRFEAENVVVAMSSHQTPWVPPFAPTQSSCMPSSTITPPSLSHHGMPLVRIKPKDIVAAGIRRVPRVVGVQDGLPMLEDGRILDVANVVWCTGSRPELSWIDLPVFEEGRPMHQRGAIATEPGFYFVGLDFLYAAGVLVAAAAILALFFVRREA